MPTTRSEAGDSFCRLFKIVFELEFRRIRPGRIPRPVSAPQQVIVTMVLLEFSMTPLGKGESVSEYVSRSLEIVEASGLDYRLHAMGTVIEGEWDEVFAVVKKCYEAISEHCDRITCSIKVDARKGTGGRLSAKVKSVEEKLGRKLCSTEEDPAP